MPFPKGGRDVRNMSGRCPAARQYTVCSQRHKAGGPPNPTEVLIETNRIQTDTGQHCGLSDLKILLRQTVAQEDRNATRKSGYGQSQRRIFCLAVSLVREGFAWNSCPEEESDWHCSALPG